MSRSRADLRRLATKEGKEMLLLTPEHDRTAPEDDSRVSATRRGTAGRFPQATRPSASHRLTPCTLRCAPEHFTQRPSVQLYDPTESEPPGVLEWALTDNPYHHRRTER